MKATHFYDSGKITLPQKSIKSLAIFATFLLCLISSSTMAQGTKSPQPEGEPVDPAREKQKEIYFKKLNQGEFTPVEEKKVPVVAEPVDPAREQQKADYEAGKHNTTPEALPDWVDTGNFEADKAAYLLAVSGWLERNASLYTPEELEFLTKPILTLEERQQNLNNN